MDSRRLENASSPVPWKRSGSWCPKEYADFPLREALAIRSRAGKDARGVLQFPF